MCCPSSALETTLTSAAMFHGTEGPIIVRSVQQSCRVPVYADGVPRRCQGRRVPGRIGPESPRRAPASVRLRTTTRMASGGARTSDTSRCPGTRLNLTIRPDCTTHRVIIEDGHATGVEVESGGEKFVVEGDQDHSQRGRNRLAADTDAVRYPDRRITCARSESR